MSSVEELILGNRYFLLVFFLAESVFTPVSQFSSDMFSAQNSKDSGKGSDILTDQHLNRTCKCVF